MSDIERDPNGCRLRSPLPTSDDCKCMNTFIYRCALLISSYPRLYFLLTIGFLLMTGIASVLVSELPVFDDPAKEFVTINTWSSIRLNQLEALQQNTLLFPDTPQLFNNSVLLPAIRQQARFRRSVAPKQLKFCFEDPDQSSGELWTRFASMGKIVVSMDKSFKISQPFENGTNLFSDPSVVPNLCTLQQRLESLPAFQELCSKTSSYLTWSSTCCQTWSLPNFIASLVGKSSCDQVLPEDSLYVQTIILDCLDAFQLGKLTRTCWDDETPSFLLCPDVPPQCFVHPYLLVLLATSLPITDDNHGRQPSSWRNTLLILPVWRHHGMELWRELSSPGQLAALTDKLSTPLFIQGIELGVYNSISSEYLLSDCRWLGLGAFLLCLLLLLATRGSLGIVLTTFGGVAWSLLVAYAVYSRLLGIPTFPLINMMSVVLLLGLSADDILLYFEVWCSLSSLPSAVLVSQTGSSEAEATASTAGTQDLEMATCSSMMRSTVVVGRNAVAHRLASCLRHATPSVFLTSLSTLAGLLITLSADIVAVKRFAVFSSLCVTLLLVCVLLIMPCLLPLLGCSCSCVQTCGWRKFKLRLCTRFTNFLVSVRYIFPIVLVSLFGICSYFLFYVRLFSLPQESLHTPFYQDSHPAELYLGSQGRRFWAERTLRQHQFLLYIDIVFGVLSVDHQNPWKWVPESPTYQVDLDPQFNLTGSIEARAWLSLFCSSMLKHMPKLFKQEFMAPPLHSSQGYFEESILSSSLPGYWCPFGSRLFSLDNYISSLTCSGEQLSDCCVRHPNGIVHHLNFRTEGSSEVVKRCLLEYVVNTKGLVPSGTGTGLHFLPNNSEPVALRISLASSISLSEVSYAELRSYTHDLEAWFAEAMKTIPASLSSGFLVSRRVADFDVYRDLLDYLPRSVGLSAGIATLLVLCSSRSLLLSLVALLSVLVSQMLCLLLLVAIDGWSLGVVEALIFSLSAGLAIDPCLHLAYAIARSPNRDASWPDRCRSAFELVGGAVTLAALSTAVAGVAMLPSGLKCYHQVGVFLCLLMLSSWLICGLTFTGTVACFPECLLTRTCLKTIRSR